MGKPKRIPLKDNPLSKEETRKFFWAKFEREPPLKVDLTLRKEMTVFNNPSAERHRMQEYDHFFAYTKTFPVFDTRRPRCNGVFLPDIFKNIFEQEKNKSVPVLNSLEYGRPCRPPYDHNDGVNNRQAAMKAMCRKSGVFPVIEREGQSPDIDRI